MKTAESHGDRHDLALTNAFPTWCKLRCILSSIASKCHAATASSTLISLCRTRWHLIRLKRSNGSQLQFRNYDVLNEPNERKTQSLASVPEHNKDTSLQLTGNVSMKWQWPEVKPAQISSPEVVEMQTEQNRTDITEPAGGWLGGSGVIACYMWAGVMTVNSNGGSRPLQEPEFSFETGCHTFIFFGTWQNQPWV